MKAFIREEAPKMVRKTVDVGCTSSNGLVHLFGRTDDHAWRRSFQPEEAAKIWSVVLGNEYGEQRVHDVDGTEIIVSCNVDGIGRHSATDVYTFFDVSLGAVLFEVEAYQGNVLGWAIERCCAIALDTSTPGAPSTPAEEKVWVVSVRRILTGDIASVSVDAIGGYEQVYERKPDALAAAKRAIRECVVNAYTEGHWEHASIDETTEDVFREGLASFNGDIMWLHDGLVQSFKVELSNRKVNR